MGRAFKPARERNIMTKTVLAIMLSVIGTLPAGAQTYTVLHNFAGPPADGSNPSGRFAEDSAGNLYGTTPFGNSLGSIVSFGLVFKLDSSGKETVLYNFAGPPDGS